MTRERRSLNLPVEIRSGEGEPVTIRGYAYRFGDLSSDLGGFRERVLIGAGRDSLAANDVTSTFNHDSNHVLGRSGSGTLRTGEDEVGGWYEVDLPNTTTGRDLAELLRRGDVRGSSFTFRVKEGGQRRAQVDDPETGLPIREITSMDVIELGPVLNPAYPTTQVALRSLDEWIGTQARSDSDEPIDHTRNLPPLVRGIIRGE